MMDTCSWKYVIIIHLCTDGNNSMIHNVNILFKKADKGFSWSTSIILAVIILQTHKRDFSTWLKRYVDILGYLWNANWV